MGMKNNGGIPMKRFLCSVFAFLMIVSCASAEKTHQLPQKDEKGRTTYVGEVGWLFDDNGDYILESLFDEAVLWIEEIPEVYDVCIVTEEGKYYNSLNIAIVCNSRPSVSEAKEIADSAIRTIGSLFGMTDKYDGPTKDNFGTIFDDYMTLIAVFPRIGNDYIVMGAVASSYAHITW